MFDNTSVVTMYAVSPCHVGSGSSLGVVDLPIQRERPTNWPEIPASGVKGAFRADFDQFKSARIGKEEQGKLKDFSKLTESIFGSDTGKDGGYAGSLSVSDARILAYPMRSNIAPFVWITCPAVLKRLLRDLGSAGRNTGNVRFSRLEQNVKNDSAAALSGITETQNVLLEDYEVRVSIDEGIKTELGDLLPYLKDAERLIVVSDDIFDYGVSDCTQINAQIRIDGTTGTTATGSLRYQEELPSDTMMYCVIHWGDSHNTMEENLKAQTIRRFITKDVIAKYVQIGGDSTLGRGIFELDWNDREAD